MRGLHAAFELGADAVRREDVRGDHRPVVRPEVEPMRVAVVGATGAVGSTMLGVMRERSFPADEVVPFASERSAGRTIDWGEREAHGAGAARRTRSRASTSRSSPPAPA